MTLRELFLKADKLKEKIDNARPLNEKEIKELENYFKIGLTYSSNALEGNSLTISETKILLEDGITVGGKPIKDYYEATGHSKAYDFMIKTAKSSSLMITEDIIQKLHFLFYNGIDSENAGQYRTIKVFISGTEYVPPAPEKVAVKMSAFIKKANEQKGKVHPIEWAAFLHNGLVDIHPFVDGNGRTARLLANIALVNDGYGVVSIPPVLRKEYIHSLIASQRKTHPNNEPIIRLLAECVIETLKDYCRLLDL